MVDNSLRGMRLGGQSLETEDNVQPADRQTIEYRTKDGESISVIFSIEAEVPDVWHTKNGVEAFRVGGNTTEVVDDKPTRSHWDMLVERRPPEELERILQERLDELRKRTSAK